MKQAYFLYMRIGLGLCALAIWLRWVTPQQPAEQNLLSNPGFEGIYRTLTECTNHIQSLLAEGWNDNTCWDATKRHG